MRFSIITPAYNMERWIAHTIESVISQEGDFDIDYIIVDDASVDGTKAIVRSYEKRLASGELIPKCRSISLRYIKQTNSGMYQAINHGFAEAVGDIFSWINADDLYQPGALAAMAAVFTSHSDIEWLKGITATIDEKGNILLPGACRLYHQDWLQAGVYGMEAYFVEQDSVFWRASLWEKAGGIPPEYRSAGDYWLWLSFARHAPLWSLNVPVSMFRKREGQISKNIKKYKEEQRYARGTRPTAAWIPRLFFYPYFHLPAFLQPGFERFYSIFFPRRSRNYLELENGAIRERIMPSFILR